jgi:hypothetical protein
MHHNYEEPSVTAEHIVQAKNLNILPLTMEQAIIIQGFTGLNIVPPELFDQDKAERLNGGIEFDTTQTQYREDFLRLVRGVYQNEMDDYPALTKMVYRLIEQKMDNDPFACWDTRVDILIATHLNHKTQASLRVSIELEHQGTIEFTERPGPTPQTWIVINRPDPTADQLNVAITNVVEQMHGDQPLSGTYEMILPMSLPTRVEQSFSDQVKALYKLDSLEITRGRFTRHQTKLTLTKGSDLGINDGGSGALEPAFTGTLNEVRIASQGREHDERGWQPK